MLKHLSTRSLTSISSNSRPVSLIYDSSQSLDDVFDAPSASVNESYEVDDVEPLSTEHDSYLIAKESSVEDQNQYTVMVEQFDDTVKAIDEFGRVVPLGDENGISLLLTKPTINSILEKTRYGSENSSDSGNYNSESERGQSPIEVPTTRGKARLSQAVSSEELIEEVEKHNSKLFIHRRMRKTGSSFTASESELSINLPPRYDGSPKAEAHREDSAAGEKYKHFSSNLDGYQTLDGLLRRTLWNSPRSESRRSHNLKDPILAPVNVYSVPDSLLTRLQIPSVIEKKRNAGQESLPAPSQSVSSFAEVPVDRKLTRPHSTSEFVTAARQTPILPRPRSAVTLDVLPESASYLHPVIRNSFDKPKRPHTISEFDTLKISQKYHRAQSESADTPKKTLYQPKDINVEGNKFVGMPTSSNGFPSRSLFPSSRSAYLQRKGELRRSCRSLSGFSSFSDASRPTLSDSFCSCGQPSMHGMAHKFVLEKITEENEQDGSPTSIDRAHVKCNRVRKCRLFSAVFIVFVAVACTLAALLHNYLDFYPNTLNLNAGDIKRVARSDLFCGSVKITSASSQVKVSGLSEVRLEKSTLSYAVPAAKQEIVVDPYNSWKRDFYLLKDSNITVNLKSEYLVEVMFFSTHKKLDIWSDRKSSNTYDLKYECCSNRYGKEGSVTLNSRADAYYFLVVYNPGAFQSSIRVELDLWFDRKTYDFAYTSESCLAAKGAVCTATLAYLDYIIVEIPREPTTNSIVSSSEIRWQCQARVWAFALFYICIFILSSALTLGLYKCFSIAMLHGNILAKKCKPVMVEHLDHFDMCYSDSADKPFDSVSCQYSGISTRNSNNNNHIFPSMYSDNDFSPRTQSHISESSDQMNKLLRQSDSSSALGHPRHSKSVSSAGGNYNDYVATIYTEKSDPLMRRAQNESMETTDSGISMEHEFNPAAYSSPLPGENLEAANCRGISGKARQRFNSIDTPIMHHLLRTRHPEFDQNRTELLNHIEQVTPLAFDRHDGSTGCNRVMAATSMMPNQHSQQYPPAINKPHSQSSRPRSTSSEANSYQYRSHGPKRFNEAMEWRTTKYLEGGQDVKEAELHI